jgi:hypothetical protein
MSFSPVPGVPDIPPDIPLETLVFAITPPDAVRMGSSSDITLSEHPPKSTTIKNIRKNNTIFIGSHQNGRCSTNGVAGHHGAFQGSYLNKPERP